MNLEAMKSQTIGVEVEMNNITRQRAASIVAQFFGTHEYYAQHEYGYQTWACKDNQDRVWKFQRDVSIAGDEDHKCEMVTPILKYEDIETLQEIVRTLRKAGAKSDATRGCGVHIHIGKMHHTAQTLRNLTNIMASHEDLLIKALGISRSRLGQYCKTVDTRYLAQVNKKKPTTMDDLADIWYKSQGCDWGRHEHYNASRYHILNLHATFTKGTIEFRCFEFKAPADGKQNGLHAGELKAYIQLCLALSQQALDSKTASSKKPETSNPKFTMRTWLVRMGLIGDEFKTCREVLTKNLEGDAAFKNGR